MWVITNFAPRTSLALGSEKQASHGEWWSEGEANCHLGLPSKCQASKLRRGTLLYSVKSWKLSWKLQPALTVHYYYELIGCLLMVGSMHILFCFVSFVFTWNKWNKTNELIDEDKLDNVHWVSPRRDHVFLFSLGLVWYRLRRSGPNVPALVTKL